MRGTRSVATALTFVVVSTVIGVAGAAPASADPVSDSLQTLAAQATAQAAAGQSLGATVPVLFSVAGIGESCQVEIGASAGYSKPAFSGTNYEWLQASIAGSCRGFDYATISNLITDRGVTFLSSAYNAVGGSSATGPRVSQRAVSEQNVPIYQFPYNYHGFGSILTWTARFHFQLAAGWTGSSDVCVGFWGVYGQSTLASVPC